MCKVRSHEQITPPVELINVNASLILYYVATQREAKKHDSAETNIMINIDLVAVLFAYIK